MQNKPTYQSLQARWERSWRTYRDDLRLRLRRSISWLGRAEREMEHDDPDAAFIFYWIAFNAAYAEGQPESQLRERKEYERYLKKIIGIDIRKGSDIHWILRNELLDPIKNLLAEKYLFDPFWDDHKVNSEIGNWEDEFKRNRCRAERALDSGNTSGALLTLFARLYVLRNQLLHGGATWDGSANRTQVENGARIMALVIPQFIDVMMKNSRKNWGENYYPYIGPSHLRRS